MGSTEKKVTVTPGRKGKRLRTVLIILFLVFVIIQFFQPDKNNNSVSSENDISSVVPLPDSVREILKVACFDCHSNNTVYPWYTNIQPVGWWLANHIEEGKAHLNFNEFANMPARNGRSTRQRQEKVLGNIRETVEEGEMPLNSYLWIHANARLSPAQKLVITNWADSSKKIIAGLPQH